MKLSGLRLITALAGFPAIIALPIIGCGAKKDAETTVNVTDTDKAIDKITIEEGDALTVNNAKGWTDKSVLELIQTKVNTKIKGVDSNAKEVVVALVGTIPKAPGASNSAEVKFTVKAKAAADGTFLKEFTIKVNQAEE
ncbi:hypothetical protein [Spiroplasma endosymbiont of Agriotes lineatus]|uniref:hypothetical protein n=1 Tax=Spiroplasma endosymbiont of Agriotes lineatus TaxID=3077930 RepID=UPI0030CB00E3